MSPSMPTETLLPGDYELRQGTSGFAFGPTGTTCGYELHDDADAEPASLHCSRWVDSPSFAVVAPTRKASRPTDIAILRCRSATVSTWRAIVLRSDKVAF
ncbi:MAG: hypothetical protein R3E58_04740 [Phycisphaerae bacterium]